MLILDAVLETYEAGDFTPWPIAEPPADGLLALSGRMSPREVGTAMAVLTAYNDRPRERRPRDPENGAERLRRLVAAAPVIAPGGLRLRDTATGVTAPPGCCFGLENWRDWFDFLAGEEPWLGHDPAPGIVHSGKAVRLQPEGDDPAGPSLEIPLAELAELLGSVREDLGGFLTLVELWVARSPVPTLAYALRAKLDQDLAVGLR